MSHSSRAFAEPDTVTLPDLLEGHVLCGDVVVLTEAALFNVLKPDLLGEVDVRTQEVMPTSQVELIDADYFVFLFEFVGQLDALNGVFFLLL